MQPNVENATPPVCKMAEGRQDPAAWIQNATTLGVLAQSIQLAQQVLDELR